MLAGIREILIITTPEDQISFQHLLGDGSSLGMSFTYISQPSPDGIAQAFILGKDFIGKEDVCLILGDNIYHGNNLEKLFGFPIPEKITNFLERLNFLIFKISYFVLKIFILGFISFISFIIFLLEPEMFFIKTASYLDKLSNFSLNGPEGISIPFPSQLRASKQTNL